MKRTYLILLNIILITSSLFGQFGKNKVTYDSFNWKYIQTENFDIYFYDGGEKLAEFAAPIAEEQIKRICNLFNWRMSRRFSLILYNSHNDFQQTNVTLSDLGEGTGGFTELFKNRAVVQFTGDYNEFWHVIRHELLHVVVNDLVYGGSLQNVISGRIRLNIPLWMHEGLAEYISVGWDTEADMIIRDIALNASLPPIKYLNYYLAYKGGQSVYNFLVEKYGVEKVGEIWQQVKSHKNVDKGLEEAIGLKQEELTKEWHKWVKRKYWPDIAKRDNIEDIATQITTTKEWRNYFNAAPTFSPNGTQIAFLSNKNGYVDIYIIDAFDGKIIKKLLKGQRTPETEELKFLTPQLSWSHDGKKIVLASKSGGSDAIIIVDVESEKQEILQFDELEQIFSPIWANKSNKIALIGLKNENRDIFIYDAETKRIERLTNDIYSDYDPSWATDDKSIYFSSQRGFAHEKYDPKKFIDDFTHHQKDIFMININSKELARITNTKWNEKFPIKSNTKNGLIYSTDFNGVYNFFYHDLDNGQTKAITNILTGVFQPELAKDDSKIVFVGYAEYGYDIFSISNPLRNLVSTDSIPPTQYAKAQLNEWKKPSVDILSQDKKLPVISNRLQNIGTGNYSNYDFSSVFFKNIETSDTATTKALSDSTIVKLSDTTKYIDKDGNYVITPYKTRFSLDLVNSQADYSNFWGVQGNTVFLFSDILGDHRFALGTEMYIDLENSDYYLNYQYLSKKTNYSFTGFHSANFYSYYDRYRNLRMLKWRNYGFDISINKPITRFARLEYAATLFNVEQKDILVSSSKELSKNTINSLLPRIGFVFDNSLWGYLNPIDGTRYKFDITGSPKYNDNSLEFITLYFDFRKYFKINWDYSFAIRLSSGISEGADPQPFFLGGESGWLNPKYNRKRNARYSNVKDVYFSRFITPIRGANYYEREGDRYFVTNIEFRYPLIKYLQIGFPIPMILGGIQGVSFLDIGSAWYGDKFKAFGHNKERGIYFDDLIGGFGFGSRIYLGYFVLKIDTAWKFDLDTISKPKYLFSMGLDF